MLFTLRIAYRNLLRQRRRSTITGVTIILGLGLLLVSLSLQEGGYREMINTGIDLHAGHLVVQRAGYQASRDADLLLPSPDLVESVIEAALPRSIRLRRVFLDGLMMSPRGTVGIAMIGVEPDREAHHSNLDERVTRGTWVTDREDSVVIGEELAHSLEVDVGDKIVFLFQTKQEMESHLFHIAGIFESGSDELDGFLAVSSLSAAQSMLHTDSYHQLAIYLSDLKETEIARENLRHAMQLPRVEIFRWEEALPELYDYVVIDRYGGYVFLAVIGFIVFIGILNTMSMSVMERSRELSVLSCLGMRPMRILVMVVWEACLLGAISTICGMVFGISVSLYFVYFGLDYSALFGGSIDAGGVTVDPRIHGAMTWGLWASAALATLASTFIAGLIPGWRASQQEPLSAI